MLYLDKLFLKRENFHIMFFQIIFFNTKLKFLSKSKILYQDIIFIIRKDTRHEIFLEFLKYNNIIDKNILSNYFIIFMIII